MEGYAQAKSRRLATGFIDKVGREILIRDQLRDPARNTYTIEWDTDLKKMVMVNDQTMTVEALTDQVSKQLVLVEVL